MGEKERGWGSRPDGYSLHVNDRDREAYIADYWARMPSAVPDEYSRPDGTPYEYDIDEKMYEKVGVSKNGLRFHDRAPGSGGTNGWIPLKDGGHGKK